MSLTVIVIAMVALIAGIALGMFIRNNGKSK
ncbi:hypothetical protein SAMN04488539_1454 [Corynebacterium timonense]|uniref:Uncharacterized protein n=1 Tax=Corynebacterium timonense TaxID=441500 RepID=A0A1H1RD09_9CORY|nr:hypothetical protein SAMN04488539_1454 [Corynebacterium timonense]